MVEFFLDLYNTPASLLKKKEAENIQIQQQSNMPKVAVNVFATMDLGMKLGINANWKIDDYKITDLPFTPPRPLIVH